MVIGLLAIFCLCVMAIGVLSVFGAGLWSYCVPAALTLYLVWLHVFNARNRFVAEKIVKEHPTLFAPDERAMLLYSPSIFVPRLDARAGRSLARYAIIPAMPVMQVSSLIYGAACLIAAAWGPALLSGVVLFYVLLGPLANAFDTRDEVHAEDRAVDRYIDRLRREGAPGRGDTPQMIGAARDCYSRLGEKLEYLLAESDEQASLC